jgi:Flp pilus assembly protein CpaB
VQLKSQRVAGTGIRGVLSSRQGAVAFAFLCAVAAAAVLIFALGRYKKSVNTTAKQATVLVATGLIQKGDEGNTIASEQLYRPMPVLASQVPAAAITDGSELAGKFANSDILPGQQLTIGQFSAAPGPVGQLSPNERAVSLLMDPQHGLGGTITAGDYVDVYGAFTPQNGGPQFVVLVVPNARVLKAPGTGGGDAATGGTTLLKVPAKYAPQLSFTADFGKAWLVLRGGNATDPVKTITWIGSILDKAQWTPGNRKFDLTKLSGSSSSPQSNLTTGARP